MSGIRREMNCNNASGYTGVNWSKEKGKWHSKIGYKYKRIHLGYFSDIEKAIEAYEKAKLKYFGKGKK